MYTLATQIHTRSHTNTASGHFTRRCCVTNNRIILIFFFFCSIFLSSWSFSFFDDGEERVQIRVTANTPTKLVTLQEKGLKTRRDRPPESNLQQRDRGHREFDANNVVGSPVVTNQRLFDNDDGCIEQTIHRHCYFRQTGRFITTPRRAIVYICSAVDPK